MDKLHPENALIFKVAIAIPIYRLFDYLAPEAYRADLLKPGVRLEVPFGKATKIAFLIEVTDSSEFDRAKLKRVVRVLDELPLLSAKDMALLTWASGYYHHPLGEVICSAFPVGLRQGKPASVPTEKHYGLTEQGKAVNADELKRSPKQREMLQWFQSLGVSLSEAELNMWHSNFRPILSQLMEKQLVQSASVSIKTSHPEVLVKQASLQCNPQQELAIKSVLACLDRFGVFLLEGVTGSGKTEVYMQIIHSVLQRGQQILVLLPEITLTPQLEERFRQRFAVNLAISHSKLTDVQRQRAWLSMQQGSCSILLGTRSTLFTPLKNPGLIILDEEHDSSFKQQEGFRFSARDVAVMRGKLLDIPVVLGSATPALETLYNVENKRYRLLQLPERAGNAMAPTMQLLDIRNKKMQEGLSESLIAEISQTLAKKEQVLLFLNRRGFAPTLICHGCGWVARCQRCDANQVIHFDESLLRCHHCGKEQRLFNQCPACETGALIPLGLGTERVEKVLTELFPDNVVARLDRDSTQRKGSLENYLERINQGQINIILGTQMLAKGHHFPNVTLVAVLDVDSGLFSIDFHAAEKLAQLIVQVSGRAGRAEKAGKVILQTRRPEHSLLNTLINKGYNSFAKQALAERKAALLPPFSYQVLLRVRAVEDKAPQLFLNAVSQLVRELDRGRTQILGPVSAPMARRAGLYRFQLLFQNTKRQELHALLDVLIPKIDMLKQSKKVRWSLDVDPVDLY